MAVMDKGADGRDDATNRLAAQWDRLRARLQAELGEAEYRSWIRHAALGGLDGDELAIFLPSHFLRDWVRAQHGPRLTAAWQAENPAIRRVDVRIGGAPATDPPPAPIDIAKPALPATPRTADPAPRTGEIGGLLDPRFTFANFVVGKPNEFAYACARRVAERPASHGFNPLFLYGGVGLGKTHLMHAIAWDLPASVTNGVAPAVAYMSAEQFMHRFIGAIRSQATLEFKDQLRGVDVLMIDDVQFLIGKDATQEEFFHTFNALVDAGKQIVVSADKSPSDLSIEGRLRTRLGCGMVADLHATTFELRMSILESKAALSQAKVPAKVLEFLAHKITSSVRELEGALNRLIAHANLFDRPITLEGALDVLADLLRAHDRRVTIDEIQRKVAEHYNMRLSDMASPRRARSVARPRQIAMYLAKHLTNRSLPEIGRKFGNRDHTTVLHAVGRVGELMSRDVGFAEDIALLRRTLEG